VINGKLSFMAIKRLAKSVDVPAVMIVHLFSGWIFTAWHMQAPADGDAGAVAKVWHVPEPNEGNARNAMLSKPHAQFGESLEGPVGFFLTENKDGPDMVPVLEKVLDKTFSLLTEDAVGVALE